MLIEIVIRELSGPLTPSAHSDKYRRFYGAAGVCHVRYDNERGKGDHRHLGEQVEDYLFTTLVQLLPEKNSELQRAKPVDIGRIQITAPRIAGDSGWPHPQRFDFGSER